MFQLEFYFEDKIVSMKTMDWFGKLEILLITIFSKSKTCQSDTIQPRKWLAKII